MIPLLLLLVWLFSSTLALQVLPSIAEFHERFKSLSEGKHPSHRVSMTVVVDEIKQTSSRLVFLRTNDSDNDDDKPTEVMELLLRERDGFMTTAEINSVKNAVVSQQEQEGNSTSTTILQCVGFPEKLGMFDGPSFFPQLTPSPTQPVCLHVVAANVTLSDGKLLQICPFENKLPRYSTTITSSKIRMPPTSSIGRRSGGGAGYNNRNRGGIFAAWAIETFNLEPEQSNDILDIAGGSGQLAFQLGVRRGFNVTVVDPRQLKLASDQQRTLQFHRKAELRLLPGEPNPALPLFDYGHHFHEICTLRSSSPIINDRTFLVSGDARVRSLQMYFDSQFVSTQPVCWQDCSVVLAMHPDSATEDVFALALKHNKPFAVAPCCVFWKRDPQRRTPQGKPVRTWEQFCDYLQAKDTRIQRITLPFPGRNIILYSLGGSR